MTVTPGSEVVLYRGDDETIIIDDPSLHGYDGSQRAGPSFDADRKRLYVKAIRRGARRRTAAEAVGVGTETVWRHMRDDDAFNKQVLEAEESRVDEVEAALYESAIQGNVTAMQVVLYNRRSDEWADMRQLHARLEAAKVADNAIDVGSREDVRASLRDKLAALQVAVVIEETERAADETETETETVDVE